MEIQGFAGQAAGSEIKLAEREAAYRECDDVRCRPIYSFKTIT